MNETSYHLQLLLSEEYPHIMLVIMAVTTLKEQTIFIFHFYVLFTYFLYFLYLAICMYVLSQKAFLYK